jgi:hypothetical protein
MSKAALSVFVFGIYMVVAALGFMLMPNMILSVMGIPTTTEVWIRIVAVLMLFIAYYYIQAARSELTGFFHWTIHTRVTLIIFMIVFAVTGLGSPMLIGFGVVDLLGAIWTAWALRSS